MNVVVDVISDCWMLSFIWFIRLWLLPIQSNTSPRPPQRINHYLQKESILNTKYPFSLEIFPVSRFMFCLKFSCYWKYEVLNLVIVIWQPHFTWPRIREEIKWLSEISLLDRAVWFIENLYAGREHGTSQYPSLCVQPGPLLAGGALKCFRSKLKLQI